MDERDEAITYSMTMEGGALPAFMDFDTATLDFTATAEVVGQWVLMLRATDIAGKFLDIQIIVDGKGKKKPSVNKCRVSLLVLGMHLYSFRCMLFVCSRILYL